MSHSNKALLICLMLAGVAMLSACSPSEKDAYENAVQPELDRMAGAIAGMYTLLEATNNDKTLWVDPEWQGKLRADADIVRQSYEALSAITPPDRYKDFHAQMISAAQDCTDAADGFVTAAETRNFDLVPEALDLQKSCDTKFEALDR